MGVKELPMTSVVVSGNDCNERNAGEACSRMLLPGAQSQKTRVHILGVQNHL